MARFVGCWQRLTVDTPAETARSETVCESVLEGPTLVGFSLPSWLMNWRVKIVSAAHLLRRQG